MAQEYFVQMAHCPTCDKAGYGDGDFCGETWHLFFLVKRGNRFVNYKSACSNCQCYEEEDKDGKKSLIIEKFHHAVIEVENWDVIEKEIKLYDEDD